jgi:hypothetical protein
VSFISETFHAARRPRRVDQAFLMMPFANDAGYAGSDVAAAVQRALATLSPPVQVIRTDSIFSTDHIVSRIWDYINASGVLLADLSTRNPNVMYEVGLCHALGRDVVLFAHDENDVPSDLRMAATWFTYGGIPDLEAKLPQYVQQYLKDNAGALSAIDRLADMIATDPFVLALFDELHANCGQSIRSHIDNSPLKEKWGKKKFDLALSCLFLFEAELFALSTQNPYGVGTIQITPTGEYVRERLAKRERSRW